MRVAIASRLLIDSYTGHRILCPAMSLFFTMNHELIIIQRVVGGILYRFYCQETKSQDVLIHTCHLERHEGGFSDSTIFLRRQTKIKFENGAYPVEKWTFQYICKEVVKDTIVDCKNDNRLPELTALLNTL